MREVPNTEPNNKFVDPDVKSDFVLEYKEKSGRPYIADLLGVSLYKDIFVKSDMDTIDDWVIMEIGRRELNGKKSAYEEIVDDLSTKLELSPNIDPREKVKKLATLLRKALNIQKTYKGLGIDLKSLEELYSNEDVWSPMQL